LRIGPGPSAVDGHLDASDAAITGPRDAGDPRGPADARFGGLSMRDWVRTLPT